MSDDLRSNSLETYWMPFTPNREFKADPRMVVGAKGMHYIAADGHKVLDGTSGLWCSNAGHGRDEIVQAIQKQAAELDFISTSIWAIRWPSNSPTASPASCPKA